MTPRKRKPDHTRVVGYVRVSTEEQANSGLGLAGQLAAIETECERRNWTLVETFTDAGISGKSIASRPGLAAALAALADAKAGGLVVAKLDRLSRSLQDYAGIKAMCERAGWNLVALDLGVDLSTPTGELLAGIMASTSQWERKIISQRTKDALAVLKAKGVKLGRPSIVPTEVVEGIVAARSDGHSYRSIAKALNADTPCVAGGAEWYPATIRRIALANGAK